MDLDNDQDNASMAGSRLMENSGLQSGQDSSLLNIVELEYANSNSNPNLDPTTNELPTYEMATNQPDNSPLEMAHSQSGNPPFSTTRQRLYKPTQTEPESFSPLFAFNVNPGTVTCTFGHSGFGANVDVNTQFFIIVTFCFCFGGCLFWKLH
jgi:hypothetical protein